jgi:hypothetical protein
MTLTVWAKLSHTDSITNAPKPLTSNEASSVHTSFLSSTELQLIDLTKLQESQNMTANQKIKLYY